MVTAAITLGIDAVAAVAVITRRPRIRRTPTTVTDFSARRVAKARRMRRRLRPAAITITRIRTVDAVEEVVAVAVAVVIITDKKIKKRREILVAFTFESAEKAHT